MKKLLASVLFAAAIGCATTGFAGVLSLDGFSGLGLEDTSVAPVPSAIGPFFTYSGTTVSGPTFNRPNANGSSAPTTLSATATAVPYDIVIFSVATTGTYSFLSTSNTPTYDNYTFLYSGYFTGSPLSGVLIGNDNLTSTLTSGFNYTLTSGTMYSFLTTGATNASAGSFTDTITLVPEPNTWAMVGAGLAGLMVVQRLRRRTA